jgi:hypothetical protein
MLLWVLTVQRADFTLREAGRTRFSMSGSSDTSSRGLDNVHDEEGREGRRNGGGGACLIGRKSPGAVKEEYGDRMGCQIETKGGAVGMHRLRFGITPLQRTVAWGSARDHPPSCAIE